MARKLFPQVLTVIVLALFFCFPLQAQQTPPKPNPATKPKPETRLQTPNPTLLTQSGDPALDHAILELYTVISGPAGQQRDWPKFKSQFTPTGTMGIVYKDKKGVATYQPISLDEYISTSGPFLVEKGFFEKEISRRVERYGQLVHVWSTYEARHNQADPKPVMRGINSIQLVLVGEEYKVVSLLWQPESPDLPLPSQYLPTQGQ